MLTTLLRSKSTLLLAAMLVFSLDILGQFAVDVTTDTPDANPGDGVCADAGGNCSLRAAVMEANAFGPTMAKYRPLVDFACIMSPAKSASL